MKFESNMTQATYLNAERVKTLASRDPARVAIRVVGRARDESMTYGALALASVRWAERLDALRCRPGDRVVLLGRNSPRWVAAYLGIAQRECTVVPLDRALSVDLLRALIERVEPAAILLDADLARARGAELSAVAPCLSLDDDDAPSSARPALRDAEGADRSLALIVFTSGSTARPKGVMLGRESVDASIRSGVESLGLDRDTELMCVLPLHHTMGLGMCMSALFAGGGVTFLEELAGDLLLRGMRESKTTLLPGPPRLFELLLTRVRSELAELPTPAKRVAQALLAANRVSRATLQRNLGRALFGPLHNKLGGNLKMMLSGGAPLPLAVQRGLEEFGFFVAQGYGLTETCAVVSVNTTAARRPGSVGRAMRSCEVRVLKPDTTGRGELAVRGPTVMRGYFRDPEATAACFTEDGWFRTGDLGSISADGFVTIHGRLKELIVTAAGKNVSPDAVELGYRDVDAINELAVLGMPDARGLGEQVHAAVVLAPGATEEAARVALDERARALPSYQRIQRLHVVNSIPRTPSMKVRRATLREQLVAQRHASSEPSAPPGSTARDGLLETVLAVIRGVIGDEDVKSTSALVYDLGLDSMGQLELASRLAETLGRPVELSVIRASKTVDDLARAIGSGSRGHQRDAPARAELTIPPMRRGASLRSLDAVSRFVRALWGLRVTGLERLPTRAPFILCPNHESHLDALLVAACLPRAHRERLCVFAKKEHFDAPISRAVARWIRAVPVDRLGDPEEALDAGVALLEAGRVLLIHPEGTRTRSGALGTFRRGAAHVARRVGVPLVPVRIDGAHALYPPGRALPRLRAPAPLSVRFGAPIDPRRALDSSERALTTSLRAAIVELKGGG